MPFDDRPGLPRVPDDPRIVADLRTDHAGETGAVFIYRGVLAVARDTALIAFARAHLATETEHLRRIAEVLPTNRRSQLTPLWRLAGFLTGFAPALFGPRAVYHTVTAVETFVDRHYQEQIDYLDRTGAAPSLRALLEDCRADEAHHRDDASSRAGAAPGPVLKVWMALVAAGSRAAVGAARRV